MKKNMFAVAGICFFACSSSVLAYGGMNSTTSVMSSGRMNSDYSFSLKINVPYNMTLKSEFGSPVSSANALYTDFDATQIPVHELPPLPLTLDAPEEKF